MSYNPVPDSCKMVWSSLTASVLCDNVGQTLPVGVIFRTGLQSCLSLVPLIGPLFWLPSCVGITCVGPVSPSCLLPKHGHLLLLFKYCLPSVNMLLFFLHADHSHKCHHGPHAAEANGFVSQMQSSATMSLKFITRIHKSASSSSPKIAQWTSVPSDFISACKLPVNFPVKGRSWSMVCYEDYPGQNRDPSHARDHPHLSCFQWNQGRETAPSFQTSGDSFVTVPETYQTHKFHSLYVTCQLLCGINIKGLFAHIPLSEICILFFLFLYFSLHLSNIL